jgi:hypothetical protein
MHPVQVIRIQSTGIVVPPLPTDDSLFIALAIVLLLLRLASRMLTLATTALNLRNPIAFNTSRVPLHRIRGLRW